MVGGVSPDDLASAFASLTAFAKRGMLTLRVGDLERELVSGATMIDHGAATISDHVSGRVGVRVSHR